MDSVFAEDYFMEKIDEDDRLSDLPDALIYYIFSFFDLNNATSSNMLAVSRKLRRFILSSYSLAFTVYIHHNSTSIPNFHTYLNKVISSTYDKETNTSFLKRLSLSWHRSRRVKTLDCQDSIPQRLELRALETLVVRYYGLDLRYFSNLGDLISSEFPGLKKLVISFENCAFNDALIIDIGGRSLVDVEFSCVDCSSVNRKLVIKIICPSLVRLTLKNIKFIHTTCEITIVGPQLRTLRVDRIEFSEPNPNNESHCFKIHATRLRSFYWKGTPITDWRTSAEPFPALEEAIVEIGKDYEYISRDFMTNLLRSLQHAKKLNVQQPKSRKIFGLYARRYISCC